MSEPRPQLRTESQHVLRFTAHDSRLVEALHGLHPTFSELPSSIDLDSAKGMSINPLDKYELDAYVHYRDGIHGLSNNGFRTFTLVPDFVKGHAPVMFDGVGFVPDGPIESVDLRVDLSDRVDFEAIVSSPMFGPRSTYNAERNRQAEKILRIAQQMKALPIRFKIEGELTDDPDAALERIREAVKMGAWVSNLLLVPLGNEHTLKRAS